MSSGLHGFWQEVYINSYLCSSVYNVSFFLRLIFKIFLFISGFQLFDYDVPWCNILLGAHHAYSICVFIVVHHIRKVWPLFFLFFSKIFIILPFHPLSLWYSNYMWFRSFDIIPQATEINFFQYVFFCVLHFE